ncbi:protein transport protein Sec24C [Anthonomus grandis grandis]|uniref:protein transport protein Sec24C n=1 Tax=Anthonomus grandis grandis TaxID=2921223 RepID=UPI002165C22C|nr:protein transport protein Sec24C [Anthonomus grandis grandis]
MNPQYLPPQPGNFNPPSNGYSPRNTNPNLPPQKNGPSPGLLGNANSPGVPNMPPVPGYNPQGMPPKTLPFMPPKGPTQQPPYLGQPESVNNNLGPPHGYVNNAPPKPGPPGQFNPNLGPPQGNLPPQTTGLNQPHIAQTQPGMPPMPQKPSGMPPMPQTQPGMPPMPQKQPGMPLMPQTQPGMPPMPQAHPGMPPIPQSQPGMPQNYPGMPPTQPGISSRQNEMPPMMPPPGPGQFPQQNRMPMDQMSNQMQNMSLRGPPGPGYMGQPPVRPMHQGAPGYPQPGMNYGQPQQQQQQKRLDPDQMPSPIQVIQDDQATRSGLFVTNQKGLVPPLVTTNFTVQDQGNASPRFMRSTMYNVPITQDTMKQTAVPFSLVISPMAKLGKDEFAPPIVNFGELGPVRCIRCKAYMCPYMQFIDSGRRFQCLFCKATADVPAEYFQHLDHTGQRMDKYERPELVLGTYEFVATADYCRNNTLPKPPAIVFVIDVSYNNIKSGLVNLLCARMKEIIQNLPVDQNMEKSNMKVGFITYNSSVHFYNIKGTLAGPQMMVVGDTQEMFMPLLDGFLCTPEESEAVIDALMEQIPQMFRDTKETEIVLLPAIQAGLEALRASETVGKLLVFHSSLPTAECPGKLKNRDDRKLLGTDKERTVLTPQTQAYNQLGQDCVSAGCSVDLFVLNNSFIDLATIGQVSRLTGGDIFKYTYFQADIDGDRLINDVIMDISRPVAFDGVMRVRTSTGVRPTDFYGYFFMSNTTDMELAAIDCDKGVAIEIKHDDKLSEEEGVYVQAALLYTSCSGQRRLRIMNLSLKTCSQMADLYRSCDLDTLINYLAKQATFKLLEHNPKQVKENLVNRAAQILATYRKHCATPSSAGQLILPECMKLLPLYVSCLLKSDAISGGSDMTIDDRAFAMQMVLTMDVGTSVNYFYPRLVPVHDLNPEKVEIPPPVRCTSEKMSDQGVYLLENGVHMFLWLGAGASGEFVQGVFGVPTALQVDVERPHLPELDNPLSEALRRIVEEIRRERHRHMRLTIVRQREKLEPVFKHFLVEDRGTDGSASYVDFLCHMHKEIRNLLS